MEDLYRMAEKAKKIASERLASMPDFADLAYFHLIIYTSEDLVDMGEEVGTWVGQYEAGSVDSDRGTTILLQASLHTGVTDMIDTLLHECGHAVWELIPEDDRAQWCEIFKDVRHGPQEYFADQLMFLGRGDNHLVDQLFLEITKPA